MASDEHDLLDDQIRYYRARAAEYDETSTPEDDPFAAVADRIRQALRALGVVRRTLLDGTSHRARPAPRAP